MHNAKSCATLLLLTLLQVFLALPRVSASFTSMYVFGDGVCATNDPTASIDPLYHEKRNCNGRVWVEVLWQWQGHAHDEAKNISGFGHTSNEVVTETNSLKAPADIATSLYVIWCNNADFVEYSQIDSPPPYASGDVPAWTTFIDTSISQHVQAVTNLYLKGARAILMPNAVDIAAVPNYNNASPSDKTFIRNRVIEFNLAFKSAMASLPGLLKSRDPDKSMLTIYYSDTFDFFEQVLANPSSFGLRNPYPANSPVYDLPDANKQTGPGIDYIFWDDFHPTAKFQMHLAEFFRRIVLPEQVSSIVRAGGNVRMQVANIPLGRDGAIQGSADLHPPWATDRMISEPFTGGSTTTTFTFPASGTKRFYRVGFPVVWTWP